MANYFITNCDEVSSLVINDSGFTINTGSTYYMNFTGGSDSGCFVVVSATTDSAEDALSSFIEYVDCFDCAKQNDFSFFVSACTIEGLGGPVPASQFNEFPLGKYYSICAEDFEFSGCVCFYVVSMSPEPAFPIPATFLGPYENCDCMMVEVSAGTETLICQICETPSGATATLITPPHPVWTRPDGQPVVLLDAVQLGGMYGLNG